MSVASLFNPQLYLLFNPDVAAAVSRGETTAEQHFQMFGRAEGRIASLWFDPAYYLEQNPDVAQAIAAGVFASAYDHFELHGMLEDRSPFEGFDANYYLEAVGNADVYAAVVAGLMTATQHFALYGSQELRDFNPGVDMQAWRDATNGDSIWSLLDEPGVIAGLLDGSLTVYDLIAQVADEFGGLPPMAPGDGLVGEDDDGDGDGSPDFDVPDWFQDYLDSLMGELQNIPEDLVDIEGLTAHVQQLVRDAGLDNPAYLEPDGSGLMEPYKTQLLELITPEEVMPFINMDAAMDFAGSLPGLLPPEYGDIFDGFF